MPICPANCVDQELIPMPSGGCDIKVRKRTLFKLGFYSCSETLPTPLTCENLTTLVESNIVVFSNPLVNVEWAAPETEDLVLADCLPAKRNIISRSLNFQDRIAIDVLPTSGTGGNMYADIKFWGDKMNKSLSLGYVFLFCDGSIEVPNLTASLDIYRNFERQGTGGNSYMLEVKQGTIIFKGDPLAMTEDYAPALIVDNTCPDLQQLLGLGQVA